MKKFFVLFMAFVMLSLAISQSASADVFINNYDDLLYEIRQAALNDVDTLNVTYDDSFAAYEEMNQIVRYKGVYEDDIGYLIDNSMFQIESRYDEDVINGKHYDTIKITGYSDDDYVYDTVKKDILNSSNIINATDFEKTKWAYDYVINKLEYDNNLENYTAYAGLKTGYTVCDGYADLFDVVANLLGLKTFRGSGLAFNGRTLGNHAWNYVELDGLWYLLDTTWGDVEYSEYFLRAPSNITDHYLDSEYDAFDKFASTEYSGTNNTFSPVPAFLYDIKLDATDNEIIIGEKLNLIVSNPKNIPLVFNSKDDTICTVDDNGVVTAVKEGKTYITVTNTEYNINQDVKVKVVNAKAKEMGILRVTSLGDINLTYGKSTYIKLDIQPSKYKLKDLEFNSLDPSMVKVSTTGKITALKAGTTVIKAFYGYNKEVSVIVTVKPKINSSYKNISLKAKQTKSLRDAVTISKNGYKDLFFMSLNDKVATVTKDGIVKGVKKGTAIIYIKEQSTDEILMKVKVTVK